MAVTFGASTTVHASAADPLASCKLTSSLSLVVYQRGGNLKAKTITIGTPLVANAEADINGITSFPIALARVSDTSAMTVYIKSGVGMVAQMLTISGTTVTGNAETILTDSVADKYDLSRIDATNVLCAYSANPLDANAVVLSISGTTITENAITVLDGTVSAHGITCVAFSTTKGIVTWFDTGTAHEGMVIDISGTTITTNAKKTIDAVNGGLTTGQGLINGYVSIFMSSTKAVYAFDNSALNYKAYVLTLSGSTFNIGPVTTISGIASGRIGMAGLTATNLIIATKTSGTIYTAEGFTITGASADTLTSDDTSTKTVTTTDWMWCAGVDSSNVLAHFEESSSDVALINFPEAGLGLAAMTKPADIDAAGTFIYVALLNGGTPILTKISTNLDADGTTVFDPGAGDNIGIECGRFSSDTVWVAGNFDGTNVVEKSEDAGSTFTVKDDATIGDVRSFSMGPDSDERILVFDETNGDILETNDDGSSWDSINASVTPEVNAIARLGRNVQESVFGNDGGANNSINYSVNSGDDLEDFQTGVYPNANATKVVVN